MQQNNNLEDDDMSDKLKYQANINGFKIGSNSLDQLLKAIEIIAVKDVILNIPGITNLKLINENGVLKLNVTKEYTDTKKELNYLEGFCPRMLEELSNEFKASLANDEIRSLTGKINKIIKSGIEVGHVKELTDMQQQLAEYEYLRDRWNCMSVITSLTKDRINELNKVYNIK